MKKVDHLKIRTTFSIESTGKDTFVKGVNVRLRLSSMETQFKSCSR